MAIARALVNRPQFLFADEPTGALDKKTGQEILSIIQRLNEAGNTVIMVTHSPTDAQHSKRIVHLVDGNIVRDEVVQKPLVQSSQPNEVNNHRKAFHNLPLARMQKAQSRPNFPCQTMAFHQKKELNRAYGRDKNLTNRGYSLHRTQTHSSNVMVHNR